MERIQRLDQVTIDKIAAGEVIERPASIVKELVENAIDAEARQIQVEIEEGGIQSIRVTDNGKGILREDIPNAFLRHSTSKIQQAEDLQSISTLGFRGEALSSIGAVSRVEMLTKRREDTFGSRYLLEGGKEISLEEAGASDGTVFVVRQLFYNVPARRKFLKTAATEAGHIQDLLLRLALSHPEIAFSLRSGGQEKLCTSGSGKIKDVLYQLYGREVCRALLPLCFERNGVNMTGFIGKPELTRGNRNFETFFVNGRYVKSAMISKAVEDGYKDFTMQHRFPFAVLYFTVDTEQVDVNVHPTKMEIRFQRQQEIYETVYEGIHRTLSEPELIAQVGLPQGKKMPGGAVQTARTVEPGESEGAPVKDEAYFLEKMRERVEAFHHTQPGTFSGVSMVSEEKNYGGEAQNALSNSATPSNVTLESGQTAQQDTRPEGDALAGQQMHLFEERLLKGDKKAQYRLIGQVFDTYWLVEFGDNLYIIDQHAAHERVLYEQTMKAMQTREYTSQYISPPIILSLSMQEAALLREHMDRFTRIGFEIEPFGGEEFAVRGVPDNLFHIAKKELLLEMLDSLGSEVHGHMPAEIIDQKVASMSCKAAVKGNQRLSEKEVHALLGELLTLDNPYHCPHGRPTIIAMSKRELEKSFKRIL